MHNMSEQDRIPKGESPQLVKEAIEALGVDASNQALKRWIKREKGYDISVSQISRHKPRQRAEEPTPEQLKIIKAHYDVLHVALVLIHEMGLEVVQKGYEFWNDINQEEDKQEKKKLLEEFELRKKLEKEE